MAKYVSIHFVLSLLLAILPVTYIYLLPGTGLNLGVAILLFIICPLAYYSYIKSRYIINRTLWYYVTFVIYLLIISFVHGSIGNMILLFVISLPFHLILTSNVHLYRTYIGVYLWASLFFSAFLIVQDISILFFSKPIEGILSFLPKELDQESSIYDNNLYIRISSVFIEPSHFALYVIPSVCILLWKVYITKYRIAFLLIITAAVFMSTSGNGIVLIGLIYSIFIAHSNLHKFNLKSILITIVIIFSGIVILNQDTIKNVTDNLFQENSNGYNKSDYRIKRGFSLYSELPVSSQIFGVGWTNAERFLKDTEPNLYNKYSSNTRFDYFNSMAGVLIYTGLLGFTLFFIFFYSLFLKARGVGSKTIVFIVFITMASSSIIMAEQWLHYLMIIYSTRKKFIETR